jgi:hypothetical protein
MGADTLDFTLSILCRLVTDWSMTTDMTSPIDLSMTTDMTSPINLSMTTDMTSPIDLSIKIVDIYFSAHDTFLE